MYSSLLKNEETEVQQESVICPRIENFNIRIKTRIQVSWFLVLVFHLVYLKKVEEVSLICLLARKHFAYTLLKYLRN